MPRRENTSATKIENSESSGESDTQSGDECKESFEVPKRKLLKQAIHGPL
jgi:hypothetical protein